MKKALIIMLVLGGLLAGGGWLWGRAHDPRRANMAEFETDMTEALVRGIMQELDADQAKFYFVAFGEGRTDPSRLFIARFAAHFPPVRGISSAFTRRNGQMLETAHARTGVIIQVVRIKKINAGTFDVLVQFPKEPAGESRFAYRMADAGGKWGIQRRLPVVLKF
jgi:hypothetical protein